MSPPIKPDPDASSKLTSSDVTQLSQAVPILSGKIAKDLKNFRDVGTALSSTPFVERSKRKNLKTKDRADFNTAVITPTFTEKFAHVDVDKLTDGVSLLEESASTSQMLTKIGHHFATSNS